MPDPIMHPPHYAEEWGKLEPTGRLRWRDGVLEQQWSVVWANMLGHGLHYEWHPVPQAEETPDA